MDLEIILRSTVKVKLHWRPARRYIIEKRVWRRLRDNEGMDEGVLDHSKADLLGAKISGPRALHVIIIIVGHIGGIYNRVSPQ